MIRLYFSFIIRHIMSIPQQVKTRQLIWAEYRAGNSKRQALVNVNTKLGSNLVSKWTIRNCYKRFQSADTNLFRQYDITNVIQTRSNGEEVRIVQIVLINLSLSRKIFSILFYSILTTRSCIL
jgi:hypothetical protein